MAAVLWRARSEGEVEEGSAGAQMREGERASGVLAQVAGGGAVASSTRDVGAEKAGARSSGGSYARTRELTSRAREQREREERRRARERRLR